MEKRKERKERCSESFSTPILVSTRGLFLGVNQMMKEWTKGMKGNFGTHTLRKTFGFIQRKEFGVGFDILCKRFGHSNPSITMRYLGIEDKEVNGILLNEI